MIRVFPEANCGPRSRKITVEKMVKYPICDSFDNSTYELYFYFDWDFAEQSIAVLAFKIV